MNKINLALVISIVSLLWSLFVYVSIRFGY